MRNMGVLCDKCHGSVGRGASTFEPAGRLRRLLPDRVDLCGPCSDGLISWIRRAASGEAVGSEADSPAGSVPRDGVV